MFGLNEIAYPRYRLTPDPDCPTTPPEPYDGRNTRLYEKPYCFSCGKKDNISVSRCSRCKLVHYCSRSCQKVHYPQHKKICTTIEYKVVDLEKDELHFEEKLLNMGPDWKRDTDSREFMISARIFNVQKRLSLANLIFDNIAWPYDTKEAWETVQKQYEEIQHLQLEAITKVMRPEDMEFDGFDVVVKLEGAVSLRYPFILLSLNRDDDATWYLLETWNRWDMVHPLTPDRKKDCRFHDVVQEYAGRTPNGVQLEYRVALAIIKMRLVAAYKSRSDDKAALESQQAQLNRILDDIHAANPSMLPALLNPEPLVSQSNPKHAEVAGHPTEAYFIVKLAYRLWHRIPGAKELLVARLGVNPIYNTCLELDDSDEE